LFDAMLYGQMQSAGLNTVSPLAAFTQTSESRKKNAYSVLSEVA
jgi:hypothetical protein